MMVKNGRFGRLREGISSCILVETDALQVGDSSMRNRGRTGGMVGKDKSTYRRAARYSVMRAREYDS